MRINVVLLITSLLFFKIECKDPEGTLRLSTNIPFTEKNLDSKDIPSVFLNVEYKKQEDTFSSYINSIKKMTSLEKSFAANDFSLMTTKFYPRAQALIESYFVLFSATDLITIFTQLITLFDNKKIWFYFENNKKDFVPKDLDIAAQELEKYLYFIETHKVSLSGEPITCDTPRNITISLKKMLLKEYPTSNVYFDMVLLNFCYQIKRLSALCIKWIVSYATLIRFTEDPYNKAVELFKKLKGSPYEEQANTILKNYDGLFITIKEQVKNTTDQSNAQNNNVF